MRASRAVGQAYRICRSSGGQKRVVKAQVDVLAFHALFQMVQVKVRRGEQVHTAAGQLVLPVVQHQGGAARQKKLDFKKIVKVQPDIPAQGIFFDLKAEI